MTLFAALNMFNDAVQAICKLRYRHLTFLVLLRETDQTLPAELSIHCIVDSYATYSVSAGQDARPKLRPCGPKVRRAVSHLAK